MFNAILISLLASTLRMQGLTEAADVLLLLSKAQAAGKNVDADLAEVAKRLESGAVIDWSDIRAPAQAASDDLHSDPPASGG